MSAEVLAQILSSLAWFALGTAAGYLIGQLRHEVHEIRDAVTSDGGQPGQGREGESGEQGNGEGGAGGVGGTGGTATGAGGTGGTGGVGGRGGRGGRPAFRGQRSVGFIVIVLAVATVVQAVVFERQQAIITTCQARFVQDVTDALRVRAEIADQDRANLNELVKAVLAAQPGTSRNVLSDYLARQAELDQQRRAVPLPNLPRECR